MTEDFGLEPEHREFRDAFRRFVADKVAPLAERGGRGRRGPPRGRRGPRGEGAFILTGRKLYIRNGSIADFMLVAARTGEARSAGALSMFIVETREPGVTARDLVKVGNHSSSTAFVSLEDVRVPAGRLPGRAGRGPAPAQGAPAGGG